MHVISINLATYGVLQPFESPLIATYGYHDFETLDDVYIRDHVSRAVDGLIEQFKTDHAP